MPLLKFEAFGTGDQTWLGSFRGVTSARTEVVDPTVGWLAGTHYPNGYIPSGYPVAKVGATLVPYVAGGSAGTGVLAGHILTDQSVYGTAKLAVPLMDTGRVKVAKIAALPAQSAFAAPAAASNATTIVYI